MDLEHFGAFGNCEINVSNLTAKYMEQIDSLGIFRVSVGVDFSAECLERVRFFPLGLGDGCRRPSGRSRYNIIHRRHGQRFGRDTESSVSSGLLFGPGFGTGHRERDGGHGSVFVQLTVELHKLEILFYIQQYTLFPGPPLVENDVIIQQR